MIRLIATALVLLLPLTAFAAFPFEDVDDDGIFTAGVDRDMTADFTPVPSEDLFVFSEWHVVIPAGAALPNKFPALWIFVTGHITVNASLRAPDAGGSVYVDAGGIFVGPGVTIDGKNFAQLAAVADLHFADHVTLVSRGYVDDIGIVDLSAGNSLVAGPYFSLKTQDANLDGGHALVLQEKALLVVTPGLLTMQADRVSVDGARQIKFGAAWITGDGQPLSFTGNGNVALVDDENGFFIISNPGSSVDVTGSHLPPATEIEADEVIGG